MPSNFSAPTLGVMLVVGLIIGGVGGYFYASQAHTSTTNPTSSQTLTQTKPTSSELAAALKNSQNATLSIPSYSFGKGSLDVWVTNNGSSAIVLAPHDFIYNGTFQSNIFFTILDPHVIQYGIYAYIPPGSQILVEITPNSPPITPSTAILRVYSYAFTFTYGTSKD